jgi:hypothetical protein
MSVEEEMYQALCEMIVEHYPVLAAMAGRRCPPDGQVRTSHDTGYEVLDVVHDAVVSILRYPPPIRDSRAFLGAAKVRIQQRVSSRLKRRDRRINAWDKRGGEKDV